MYSGQHIFKYSVGYCNNDIIQYIYIKYNFRNWHFIGIYTNHSCSISVLDIVLKSMSASVLNRLSVTICIDIYADHVTAFVWIFRKLSPEKTRQNDELPGIVGENKEIVGEKNRDKRKKQNTEELSGKNGDTNMDVGEKIGNDLKDVKRDDRKKETEQSITKIVEGTGSQGK